MNPTYWQPIERNTPLNEEEVWAIWEGNTETEAKAFVDRDNWFSERDGFWESCSRPSHWRPLSNPEPERTSDEVCAPSQPDNADARESTSESTYLSATLPMSASNATGSERPTRTESVATVGGTPRSDEFAKRIEGISGFMQALRSWPTFARTLETDLLAARAEIDRLKAQLTSIIPNSAPASPAWLAKVAQREDALTIAELRKEVERLTKERDELKRRLGEGPARIQELERERDSLRQQLAEAQEDVTMGKQLCDAKDELLRLAIADVESFHSQLSAATARAEEWEKVARQYELAAWAAGEPHPAFAQARIAFDALTQREQQA